MTSRTGCSQNGSSCITMRSQRDTDGPATEVALTPVWVQVWS
jgi:hypothetical protein